jgi:hypothetical protein
MRRTLSWQLCGKEVPCVLRELWSGDFGSHGMLKIWCSDFRKMTKRRTSLFNNDAPSKISWTQYTRIYSYIVKFQGLLWTGYGFVNEFTCHTHHSELQALNAIADLHNSQQPAVSSGVPWQRHLTVEILQLHTFRFYLHSLPCRNQLSIDN